MPCGRVVIVKAKMKTKASQAHQSMKKLHKRAAELWKQVCFKRDGQVCQVQKYFPQIPTSHNGYLQIDHCFSRQNKNLFYKVSNGTVVCAGCNAGKHWRLHSLDRAIDLIVQRREGDLRYKEMLMIDQESAPNYNFNKIWWLEETIKELENALTNMQELHV